MDKSKAKQLINLGVKITHRLFSPSEYIYKDAQGNLRDENGYILQEDEFWKLREDKAFDDGWYYWVGKNKV